MTKPVGDEGVDVLAMRGDRTVAIQCKLYKGSVGSRPIQLLLASNVLHKATHFICITTGRYTKAAKELAGKTGVVLIDGEGLLKVCRDNQIVLRPCSFLVFASASVPLSSDEMRIGRGRDSHIFIPDNHVSTSHAVIRRTGLRLTLSDLGSTNGTFVNGSRLGRSHEHKLKYGDEIQFAHIKCVVSMSDQGVLAMTMDR